MNCLLCQPLTDDQVYSGQHWRAVVNHNQNKLGKCMIVLKHHDEDICNLSDDELRDLWAIIRKLKGALTSCFQPDHFNYAFLMNQDAHVHLHVIPRYHGQRTFAGIEFEDSDAVSQRKLPQAAHQQIVSLLREALGFRPE